MNNDLISREALKEVLKECAYSYDGVNTWIMKDEVLGIIDNAPTVEEVEEPFITECRETSIKENLPLYFVYYEETGVLDVYVTKTKELFEKRLCSKHLSYYRFKEIVTEYLDWYSDWEGGDVK